ncbi:HAD family hydrolase [Nonomuraea sp. NPDC050556]|uniref:HAD family hydrolase n=1 Tax=Nonomuraea sp. NPDC050556 TaxID=3364369 RepID=UPI0037B853FD
MQKLALFDLDDTLVDRLDGFRRWVAEFTGRRGLSKEDAAWMIELDADGTLSTEEFFAAVHERFGLVEPVDMLWDAYRARMPELVVCPRPVLRGLRRLRKAGWRVGIVANGTAAHQRGKIYRSGLVDVVDGWAISGEERREKPGPQLFQIAARRCEANVRDGGWMIGDDPFEDIVGGFFAGLRTIWIDRGVRPWRGLPDLPGLPAPPGLRPDHVVTDTVGAIKVLLDQ